jgi:hypothetical protein
MKIRTYVAAIALGAFSAGAPAFAGTWTGAYDNTIVSTYDDGHVVDVFVEPDHSYTIVPRSGGDEITGTWADKGNQSCFTITAPAKYAGGEPLCFGLKDYEVGDTFDGTDSTGHFKAEIVKGRK